MGGCEMSVKRTDFSPDFLEKAKEETLGALEAVEALKNCAPDYIKENIVYKVIFNKLNKDLSLLYSEIDELTTNNKE